MSDQEGLKAPDPLDPAWITLDPAWIILDPGCCQQRQEISQVFTEEFCSLNHFFLSLCCRVVEGSLLWSVRIQNPPNPRECLSPSGLTLPSSSVIHLVAAPPRSAFRRRSHGHCRRSHVRLCGTGGGRPLRGENHPVRSRSWAWPEKLQFRL